MKELIVSFKATKPKTVILTGKGGIVKKIRIAQDSKGRKYLIFTVKEPKKHEKEAK